jgi:xanthine dehydrogenase YagS FAD-binding subunit
LEEAVSILQRYKGSAQAIAGGTDLVGKMKDDILPRYPEALVNLKSIPGLDYIRATQDSLVLGALTRLQDIATHPIVEKQYRALAQATSKAASPHLREMGTIGGNICQDNRCWYYRHPRNRFPCLRKGGGRCYAKEGENRYHSIFGGSVEDGCYAVHPSDVAPALVVLAATVKTSKRVLKVDELFAVGVNRTTVLDYDEIISEIEIPAPRKGERSAFLKFSLRKTIDFPIVNCAVAIAFQGDRVEAARICLNAVFSTPYRAKKAEDHLIGNLCNEESAEGAGEAMASEAKPLKHNGYMVQIARTLVKRAILACGDCGSVTNGLEPFGGGGA